MDNPKEIYLNRYPDYLASQAHTSVADAQRANNHDPSVKIIKYVLEEEQPLEAE